MRRIMKRKSQAPLLFLRGCLLPLDINSHFLTRFKGSVIVSIYVAELQIHVILDADDKMRLCYHFALIHGW